MDLDPLPILRRLEELLGSYGPTLTAYSGGVDSTVVAVAAHRVHGARALAVTGVSPSLSGADREHAARLAARVGMAHRELGTEEMTREAYRANAGDRCYHCKSELFDRLRALAESEGYAVVTTGDNLDDLGGHRPGMQAAAERGVRHPLVEAELGKAEIRALARHLDLPNHDRPASPCLASRVPDGTRVSPEVLARVEAAEAGVRALGFPVFRVRHHDEVARVEVAPGDLERAFRRREEILEACRRAGYRWAALDLGGYRSGSLSTPHPEAFELPEEGA